MTSYQRPKMKDHPRITAARLLKGWPLLVWLGTIVLFLILYSRSSRFGGMTGVVQVLAEPIAPLENARLVSVNVELGQFVKAGTVVARMDTTMLEAELAVTESTMAEAESAITGFQNNILTLVRQFKAAIKDADSILASEWLNLQRDAAELGELKKEQKRRDALFEKKLITESETNELRPRTAALENSVAAYPSLIDVHERRLIDAKDGLKEMRKWLRVKEGEDISEAIRVKMEARLATFESSKKMFQLQKDNYILRATRNGIVSQILHAPGDVIPAGEPVLRLVADHSDRVVGFLPEIHLADLSLGQKVRVMRQSGRGRPVNAVVLSIAPEVLALPGRISPIQGQPLRGRRVLLELEEGHNLIPGETVGIRTVFKWFLF